MAEFVKSSQKNYRTEVLKLRKINKKLRLMKKHFKISKKHELQLLRYPEFKFKCHQDTLFFVVRAP